jgi:hypothetical protein
MSKLINLTPHPVVVYPPATADVVTAGTVEPQRIIAAHGEPARVRLSFSETAQDHRRGPAAVSTCQMYMTPVIEGLPVPHRGVRYIVSLPVAMAVCFGAGTLHDWQHEPAQARTDLLVPSREVRNSRGTVVGCRALAQPVADPTHFR